MNNRWGRMRRALTGGPVDSRQLAATSLPKRYALPLLGSDGISSVAYAADEVILILAVAGAGALTYSPWVGFAIAVVGLVIVGTYRYNIRQVAAEGDFALVRRKLGRRPAVVLGASVLLDYVLTVAVSMSSAATFITALFPQLQGFRAGIAVTLIVVLSVVCLRGVQLMGRLAHWPLYIFLALLGITLAYGLLQAFTGTLARAESAGYTLTPETPHASLDGVFLVLLLSRSFSAGAVALSGVSTISNSVRFFKAPKQRNAALTLMLMIVITGVLLVSILYLARQSGVQLVQNPSRYLSADPSSPNQPIHQKPALYQVAFAVYGNDLIPTLLALATVSVLVIASLTAFIGFPIGASAIADRHYLPHRLRSVDSTGLYSNGVILLGVISVLFTVLFAADVFALIQLYVVGMCTSMLLTQVAVVRFRLRKLRITLKPSARRKLARDITVSAVGVVVTALVLVTVVGTKFLAGAWLSLTFILLLSEVMLMTRRHYARVDKLTEIPLDQEAAADAAALPSRVHAVVYIERVRQPALRALAYARAARPSTIEALTVNNDRQLLATVKERWDMLHIPVQLSVIDSPYRDTVSSVLDYVRRKRKKSPRDVVVVYLPEFVVAHWWQEILHRRTVRRLKKALLHEPGVATATVPWALHAAQTQPGETNAPAQPPSSEEPPTHRVHRPALYRGKTGAT